MKYWLAWLCIFVLTSFAHSQDRGYQTTTSIFERRTIKATKTTNFKRTWKKSISVGRFNLDDPYEGDASFREYADSVYGIKIGEDFGWGLYHESGMRFIGNNSFGYYFWPSGNAYEGGLILYNGLTPHGDGTKFNEAGDTTYHGQWHNGQFVKGWFFTEEYACYAEEFNDEGNPIGRIKYRWRNGDFEGTKYEGTFNKEGYPSGCGKLNIKVSSASPQSNGRNNSTEDLVFNIDITNSEGFFSLENGMYIGAFDNLTLNGPGLFMRKNGSFKYTVGWWEEGRCDTTHRDSLKTKELKLNRLIHQCPEYKQTLEKYRGNITKPEPEILPNPTKKKYRAPGIIDTIIRGPSGPGTLEKRIFNPMPVQNDSLFFVGKNYESGQFQVDSCGICLQLIDTFVNYINNTLCNKIDECTDVDIKLLTTTDGTPWMPSSTRFNPFNYISNFQTRQIKAWPDSFGIIGDIDTQNIKTLPMSVDSIFQGNEELAFMRGLSTRGLLEKKITCPILENRLQDHLVSKSDSVVTRQGADEEIFQHYIHTFPKTDTGKYFRRLALEITLKKRRKRKNKAANIPGFVPTLQERLKKIPNHSSSPEVNAHALIIINDSFSHDSTHMPRYASGCFNYQKGNKKLITSLMDKLEYDITLIENKTRYVILGKIEDLLKDAKENGKPLDLFLYMGGYSQWRNNSIGTNHTGLTYFPSDVKFEKSEFSPKENYIELASIYEEIKRFCNDEGQLNSLVVFIDGLYYSNMDELEAFNNSTDRFYIDQIRKLTIAHKALILFPKFHSQSLDDKYTKLTADLLRSVIAINEGEFTMKRIVSALAIRQEENLLYYPSDVDLLNYTIWH